MKVMLLEGKQVGYIYHVSEVSGASLICDSDVLGVSGHSFFTREKNFNIVSHHHRKVFLTVRFTIDGDKLSENYKVVPYNNHAEDGDIQWEVLVDRNIKDLHKYIVAIDFMADTNTFRLPKSGSWGRSSSDLDLIIKDPNFNRVMADDMLGKVLVIHN